MTNLPPSPESFPEDPLEPPTPSRRRRSRRDSLGFNELIGIFVAFSTIGTILFWSLTRETEVFDPASLLPLGSVPSAAVPTPTLTETPLLPDATPVEPQRVRPRVGPRTVGPQAVGPQRVGPVRFSDVPNNFWAYPFITALSQRGIIGGFQDSSFRPDQPVTRAEFATFIQKAFDKDPTQSAQKYKDLKPDFWAASAVEEATRTGFLTGYPGDVFRSSQRIPRVQALVALVSGLGLSTQSPPDQVLQTYEDASQIPSWATEKVAAASEAGLVVNYPDQKSLKPNEYATRADTAALIYQALVEAGQAEPINSEYIVQP